MGSMVGKSMDANLKKNQEFMMDLQKLNLERQIQMHNQMRERAVALQVAQSRELLYWFSCFYAVATMGMLAGYRRSRNPRILIPIVPLTFVLAYQADFAYGSKIARIKAEAENIMQFELDLLDIPGGLPSPSSIDEARVRQSEERRIQKVHDVYI